MSERSLAAELKSGAESPEFNYVILIDLAFPSGNVRAHNSVGTISFGGNDYLGVGAFGSIGDIQETSELTDQPIKITLSSIDQDIIDAVKTDDVYRRDADIYLGAIGRHGGLEDATNWISGYMETAGLVLGEENAVIITIQTRAARLKQRNNKRFTLEQHQIDYPGDRFFEFLPYVINADVQWGGDKVRTGFTNTDDNLGGSAGPRDGPRGFRGGDRRRR